MGREAILFVKNIFDCFVAKSLFNTHIYFSVYLLVREAEAGTVSSIGSRRTPWS
jgi:hypothetical protein